MCHHARIMFSLKTEYNSQSKLCPNLHVVCGAELVSLCTSATNPVLKEHSAGPQEQESLTQPSSFLRPQSIPTRPPRRQWMGHQRRPGEMGGVPTRTSSQPPPGQLKLWVKSSQISKGMRTGSCDQGRGKTPDWMAPKQRQVLTPTLL